MVQLFPVKSSDATALLESMEEQDGSPCAGSPCTLTDLQLALNPSATAYHGYETYIEDGLICLRHKIRNIEKKKLLKVQRKALRREQVRREEEEQRRLSMMLQVQYVLCNLQRHDVRKTISMREYAHYLSAQEVEKLLKLALLLGCKRDESMSLEEQMEQASFIYLDLLNGKDEPVAGSTYKCLKEKLLSLVDSGLFDRIPEPEKETEKDEKQTSLLSGEETVYGTLHDGEVKKAGPVGVFNSPSSLAKDPTLRRQQLDHLMDQITGSFSFIQSTPIHDDHRSGDTLSPLANGDQLTNTPDLKLHAEERQAKQDKGYTSPPLYCRESLISVPREDENSKQVFSGEVPMTRSSEPKIDESGFLGSVCLSYSTASTLSYCTASTQTPPELSLLQDDLQMESAYLSESDISATSQIYSSPGLNSAPQTNPVQHYYPRSTLRGMTRSARGLSHSSLRSPGASRAGWSDSSQVSSPDREGAYVVDSAHGDSLSVTGSGMQITGPPLHTLMPMYPQIRVAFSAARATNLAPGTLDQPIAFDLLHSNLGGAFDAPSGHFSCPAAGTYVFFFHILKLAISVPLYVNLMRNDEVLASAYANDGAPDHETASNHAVLPLRVGDHIWLRLHRGAIYGSTWKYSTFSGFLLYPD
ncbi:Caprin-2 [Bagarius yarrelli]|uniref:Caprin-2 n=1 Tax=Bagarius yarrelli TaxID=175774 RepID=A0A556TI71_BAGYA|nr:Caprin-2 [Bagarius yarrelli]